LAPAGRRIRDTALDADTGARKWLFQFTLHDAADWDATQVPVLVDAPWNGTPRKLLYLPIATGSSTCWIVRTAESSSGNRS
jgi:glucose dehydrogenase